jgi:tetratricopeptide (TPR) repeat protein
MAPGFPGKGDVKDWTKATKFFNQGIDHASSKDYKAAIKSYNQAIDAYSYDPMFFANLGFALERNSQPKEGVDACKKAIDLQKDFGGAWENLGNCQYDLGDLQGSRDSFNHALQCELSIPKRNELLHVVEVLTKKIAESGGK